MYVLLPPLSSLNGCTFNDHNSSKSHRKKSLKKIWWFQKQLYFCRPVLWTTPLQKNYFEKYFQKDLEVTKKVVLLQPANNGKQF